MAKLPGYESRDPKDLAFDVRVRAEKTFAEYKRRFPASPQPFYVATYRDGVRQDYYKRTGASLAGAGWSMHNFRKAFDIGFTTGFDWRGKPKDYLMPAVALQRFAGIAEFYGLEWGGRWKEFPDGPHFQAPQTIEAARNNQTVNWPQTVQT